MAEHYSRTKWVIDSSSWIEIKERPESERIWPFVERLMEDGIVVSPKQVWDEIKDDPDIATRIQPYKQQVIARRATNQSLIQLEGTITHQFPALSGARGTKVKADPYVIAHAEHAGLTVVCKESAQRPAKKIPPACNARGVRCESLRTMLSEEFPDEQWW